MVKFLDFTPLVQQRKSGNIAEPLGFHQQAILSNKTGSKKLDEDSERYLRSKKAWEIATGPAKTLPMQMFMCWMSGSNVAIFSILITGMVLTTPARSLMSASEVFKPFELSRISGEADIDLTAQKAVFVLVNIAGLLFGLYRLSYMGMLPTATSDWLVFSPPKLFFERAFF